IYQMKVWHKTCADLLNVVVIVKTNVKTQAMAHVVLFSSDLELRHEQLIDYYHLRFQNEASPQQAAGYQTEGHCRGDTTVSPPSSLCKVTSQQAPRNLLIDIVDAILWPVLRPRVLYQREITG